MKTLYLHIGTPKTGTSAIQTFLCENRPVLEEKGYCYPRTIHLYPHVSSHRNAHFMAAQLFDENGERDTEQENAHFTEGLAQIASSFERFDHVVYSDESIWRAALLLNETLFSRLQEEATKQGYCIKVIVYLRRQDQFLLSRWNQSIKHLPATSMSWEKYKKNYLKKENCLLDYAGALDKLAAVIGKDNIIVRRFEKDAWVNGSLIDDFMSCIGLPVTEEFHPLEQFSNSSLQGNTLEIKRIINSDRTLSTEENLYLSNLLRSIAPDCGLRYPCCMMSQEEIRKFLKRYEAGNARLVSEYLGEEAPLFSAEIRNLPKWQPDNPYMLEDVIRFFTAAVIDLHRENEGLRQQLKSEQSNLRTFKDKLKHPVRTLLQRNKPSL